MERNWAGMFLTMLFIAGAIIGSQLIYRWFFARLAPKHTTVQTESEDPITDFLNRL